MSNIQASVALVPPLPPFPGDEELPAGPHRLVWYRDGVVVSSADTWRDAARNEVVIGDLTNELSEEELEAGRRAASALPPL